MLFDKAVCVRVVAVRGVCRVLGVFWELIPDLMIKHLLSKLFENLAFDSASSSIRLGILEGICFILENHLSHPLLAQMLPKLSMLIHDNVEAVRVAMAKVLLQVKDIKLIKFYQIVSLENLLLRLASENETSKVKRLISALLLNTYFPFDKEIKTQVKKKKNQSKNKIKS